VSVLQAVLITTLCCCNCLSFCNIQHLKSLEADAVSAVGLSFGSSGDGCSCVLAHALGLPAININGNPLLRGPPSVPQVLNNENEAAAAAAAAREICCLLPVITVVRCCLLSYNGTVWVWFCCV